METIGERLAYYIENKGFTKKDFCELADLPYSNFVRVLKNTRPLGVNTLNKVKKQLPNINVNWLLYNEGAPDQNETIETQIESLEDIIKKIINKEVSPRFERLNKNVYFLLKRQTEIEGKTEKTNGNLNKQLNS